MKKMKMNERVAFPIMEGRRYLAKRLVTRSFSFFSPLAPLFVSRFARLLSSPHRTTPRFWSDAERRKVVAMIYEYLR